MACSSPLRLYAEDIKTGLVKNHADFTQQALKNIYHDRNYF